MNQVLQKTRVAAYGLVMNENKILLSRISKALPKWQGQWALPGGGLFFGEPPEQAMIREVEEETGIIVSAISIAAIDSLHDEKSNPQFHGIRVLYHTKLIGGSLRNEIDGTSDLAAWFTLNETKQIKLVNIASKGIDLAFGKNA